MYPRELIVTPAELREIRAFVETHHYSHSVNGVKITQCFAVQHNGRLVGGVIFGAMSTTAWRKFGKTESSILELRRLVLVDEAERNSESFVIAKCLHWIRRNMKEVGVIVSYADPAYGHAGTIYRAANFEYVGVTHQDTGYLDPSSGKVYHSRALRTKDDHGNYKPFVMKLREKQAAGALQEITLPGKHCFIFRLRGQRCR